MNSAVAGIAKASFVTFYSFKGGVGRSMALINTAAILASRGFKVLVLDLDLEAPGLSYLNPSNTSTKLSDTPVVDDHYSEPSPQLGFVDLMLDAVQNGANGDLFSLSCDAIIERYTREYILPHDDRDFNDGSLHIMPAGLLTADYARRFDALNLRGLYEDGVGEPLVRMFKKKISEGQLFDYVLIDSRTGFSDEAGICTRDLADHLMILSGLNRQNVQGTGEFLRALRTSTNGTARFEIILSPVPNGEDKLLEQREQVAKEFFEFAWGGKIDLSLQIPYHPQLSLTEEPHIFRRRRGYLYEAYSAIEQKMLRSLGHDAPTLRQKVREAISSHRYYDALSYLRYLVRLPRGKLTFGNLLVELLYATGVPNRKAEGEMSTKPVTFDTLMSSEAGRSIVEFGVEQIQLDENDFVWERFLTALEKADVSLAETLHLRVIERHPGNARYISNYAIFAGEELGKDDLAAQLFDRAIELDPSNAELLGDYAVFLARRTGMVDKADEFYVRAIEANPEDVRNISNYASFLGAQRKDFQKAEDFFTQSLALDPQNSALLCRYADFLSDKLRKYDIADEYYQKAITADPEDARSLNNYAYFLTNQKPDLEKAEVMFKRAIAAAPSDGDILGTYADFIAKGKKDYLQAKELYERAIALSPKSAENLNAYANLLADHLGDYDAADEYYQRAMRVDKYDVTYPLNYAIFLSSQRAQQDLAEKYYERARLLAPDDVDLLKKFAWFQALRRDNNDHAKELFERCISINEDLEHSLREYALFLADFVEDYERADELFLSSLEIDPRNIETLRDYALFLESQGDFIMADRLFSEALEEDDHNLITRNSYARFLVDRCINIGKAKIILEGTLEIKPDDETALSYYGYIIGFIEKNLAAAIPLYEQASTLDDENAQIFGNFGQILLAAGDFTRAEIVLKKCLDLIRESDRDDEAEICIALWVLETARRTDAEQWRIRFSSLLQTGFKRRAWDFSLLRMTAAEKLDTYEQAYLESMIDAFSDETKDLAPYHG